MGGVGTGGDCQVGVYLVRTRVFYIALGLGIANRVGGGGWGAG